MTGSLESFLALSFIGLNIVDSSYSSTICFLLQLRQSAGGGRRICILYQIELMLIGLNMPQKYF
jgi:hypothetical protein